MATNFIDTDGRVIDPEIAQEMAYIEKPYRENELGMLKSMFSCRANEALKGEKEAEYIGQELFKKKRENAELKMQKQKEIRLNNLLNDFALIVEQNVKSGGKKSNVLHNKTLSVINSLIGEGILRDGGELTQEPSQIFFYKNSGENAFSVAWDERVSIDFGDKGMNARVLNILSKYGGKQVIFETLGFEKAREGPRDFPPDKIFTLDEFKKHFGKNKNPPKAYYV